MRIQGDGDADDVPIRALAPTLRYDVEIVTEMSDTLDDYRDLQACVLLLGGSKSPAFLGLALDGSPAALTITAQNHGYSRAVSRTSCARCPDAMHPPPLGRFALLTAGRLRIEQTVWCRKPSKRPATTARGNHQSWRESRIAIPV